MLAFPDLDSETRRSMLTELDHDVRGGMLHLSNWLSALGRNEYPHTLRTSFEHGDDETLANALAAPGLLATHEVVKRRGSTFSKRVPYTAARTLAEGEFNRFYIRALCINVQAFGGDLLEVCRIKPVAAPRPESEALIGSLVPAQPLLQDLREHVGVATALGVPGGVNSGLSVRYPAP